VHLFRTNFWRQKLQSWFLGLKFGGKNFVQKTSAKNVDEIDTSGGRKSGLSVLIKLYTFINIMKSAFFKPKGLSYLMD